MFRKIRAHFEDRRRTAAARDSYFLLDNRGAELHEELGRTADHGRRAILLYKLSTTVRGMARLFPAGFGPDPYDDEGGRDASDSLAYEALLYALVGDAEKAIACPGHGRRETTTPFERQAGPILDQAVTLGLLDEKTMRALTEALRDAAGRQAVEALVCIPFPGGRSAYKMAG